MHIFALPIHRSPRAFAAGEAINPPSQQSHLFPLLESGRQEVLPISRAY
jgi:hypothetical protein